jgi:hypothetical protein
LQSVGTLASGRQVSVFVLSGRSLDGTWKVLDYARMPNEYVSDYESGTESYHSLYTNSKIRVDRTVHHRELVDKVRIAAVEVQGGSGSVMFPQIQVFAGVPLMPKMTASSVTVNGKQFSVRSRSTDGGVRVFDREASGSKVAAVGPADWYLNYGSTTRNHVAQNGIRSRVLHGHYMSMCWIALRFPSSRLLGYLYTIDDLSERNDDHANTPYAASLYFEGREIADENAVTQESVAGGWSELDSISLDQCIGFNDEISRTTQWFLAHQDTLDTFAQNLLGLSGSEKDKAYLVNEMDWRILRYNATLLGWEESGSKITAETDAIHDVDNQTHYADFKSGTPAALSQLRFTVKSIMNVTRKIPDNALVAMPEMQLFGLPAETINAGAVATITYLKAEDAAGKLHDILGRHQRLPVHSTYTYWGTTSYFRIYFGAIHNIKTTDRRIYLAIQNTSGQMTTSNVSIDGSSAQYRQFGISGDYRTTIAYFEIYLFSTSDEKIILSSGYSGGQL